MSQTIDIRLPCSYQEAGSLANIEEYIDIALKIKVYDNIMLLYFLTVNSRRGTGVGKFYSRAGW